MALLLFAQGAFGFGRPAPQAAPPAAPQAALTEKAPDFVLRDLKGAKFRLSDFKGKKPVLIIFSTTWCTFCRQEIPHFKALFDTYVKQGLEIVNIDLQESKEKVSKFTAQHNLPYRVLLDEDGTVGGIYDIRGVPSLVLVDRDGSIVCRQCRTVEPLIEAALKKR
jgi:peroxiredoxin